MSTATIDAPATDAGNATRRTPVQRPRPANVATPQLVEARQHAETAVTDLMAATTETVRAFVPAAVLRPTDAVDYAFDLCEQVLAGTRRICLEFAQLMESGLDSVERRTS
ncbi:MAG: hypothetical protein ACT4QF_23370 [Sporichthyaceae bacterium]